MADLRNEPETTLYFTNDIEEKKNFGFVCLRMVTFNYNLVLDHFYKSVEALQWSALWCF